MSHQSSQFEEIEIPAILLADMYSKSLVIIDSFENKSASKPGVPKATQPATSTFHEEVPPQAMEEPAILLTNSPVNKLGGFGKKVLVLVNEKEAVHVSDASLDLLTKMLSAVDLSMADIALVNLARQPFSLQELHQELNADTHLFFGVEPSSVGLPMRFPFFQVQQWNNKIFLYSPSLEQLNTSTEDQREQKRNLWTSLQKIFLK